MSAGTRIPLAEAQALAADLVAKLSPACLRIEPAGSIRRRRPDVGDIELVALSRFRTDKVPSLFEDVERRVDLLSERIDELLGEGTLAPHPTDPKRGDRYAKLLHPASGRQVDLFMAASRATYGLILLIRTGPAAYSRAVVTTARDRGFHVTGGELHRGRLGCGARPCEMVPTPEEADVYRALGSPYVPPEGRL